MTDTHVNAYKIELAEKTAQRNVLDGEIKQLTGKIKAEEPVMDLPTPEEVIAKQEPSKEDIEANADAELKETGSDDPFTGKMAKAKAAKKKPAVGKDATQADAKKVSETVSKLEEDEAKK